MAVTVKRGDSLSLLFSAKDELGQVQPLVDVEARGESLAKPPLEPLSPEQFEENLLAHGIIDWRQVE